MRRKRPQGPGEEADTGPLGGPVESAAPDPEPDDTATPEPLGDAPQPPAAAQPAGDRSAPAAGEGPERSPDHESALHALSTVIDHWRREYSEAGPPASVDTALATLRDTVEAFQSAYAEKNDELKQMLVSLETRLDRVQAVQDDHEPVDAAMRTIRDDVEGLSDRQLSILRSLQALSDRVSDIQEAADARQEAMAGHIGTLAEALKVSLEQADRTTQQTQSRLLQNLETMDSLLAQRVEGIRALTERRSDTLESMLTGLKAVTAEAIARAHELQADRTEEQHTAIEERFAALDAALPAVSERVLQDQATLIGDLRAGLEARMEGLIRIAEVAAEDQTSRADELLRSLQEAAQHQAERAGALGDDLTSGLERLEAATAGALSRSYYLLAAKIDEVLGAVQEALEAGSGKLDRAAESARADQQSRDEQLHRRIEEQLSQLVSAARADEERATAARTAEHDHLVRTIEQGLSSAEKAVAGAVADTTRDQSRLLRDLTKALEDKMTQLGEANADAVGRAAAETASRHQEQLKRLEERLGALEAATTRGLTQNQQVQSAKTDEVRQTLGSRLASLESAPAEAMARSHSRILERLEASHQKAADAIEASQRSVDRSSEESAQALREGMAGIEASIHQLKAELAESTERGQSELVGRLDISDSRVADALAAAMEERDLVRRALGMVAESVRQLRAESKDQAGLSNGRLLHQIEVLESRTSQAIADLRLSLSEDRRTARFELLNRIDVGVTEPLKNVVTLLARQLGAIQTGVDRTLDAVRNASMLVELNQLDPRTEYRRPAQVVELPHQERSET